MKNIKLSLFLLIFLLSSNKLMAETSSLYDFNFLDIDGNLVELSFFKITEFVTDISSNN